jgi:KDO2-lipid IV(A) lauroyltransferase
MKRAVYYIFYVFNYFITLLPLRVLYLVSDFFYFVFYYLVGYRRQVVATNLRNAFPEESEAALRQTERLFYRHLCDLFVETMKVTHMSAKQIARRFRFRDMTLLDRLYAEERDVLAFCGHYNNWEWLSSMPLFTRYRSMSIYKPLKDRYFDQFILKLRTRFGVNASPMQQILRDLISLKKKNVLTVSAFMADQTPPPDENNYWTAFLNQDTCFYRGPERIARMLDMAVIFCYIIKVRRGYYEVETKLITEHPKEETPDSITKNYVEMLEKVIREKPEYWLWSHRRWKHKRPVKDD